MIWWILTAVVAATALSAFVDAIFDNEGDSWKGDER